MAIQLKNNAYSFLANDVGATDTTIAVVTGDGARFPSVSSPDYFYVTIVDQNDETRFEIMKVTSTNNDTFTVERAQEGTSALSFATGDHVQQRITAQTIYDAVSSGVDLSNYVEKTSDQALKSSEALTIDNRDITLTKGDDSKDIISVPVTFQKLPLDKIVIGRKFLTSYTSANNLKNFNKRFANHLVMNWDYKYGQRVSVDVLYPNNDGTPIYGLRFDTLDDIYSWYTNNVPQNAGQDQQTVHFYIYDEIDPTIPVPEPPYVFNAAFGALKGRRRYKTTNKTAEYTKLTDSLLKTLFNIAMGAGVTSSQASNIKKTLWVGNAKENIYITPTDKYRVDFTANNGGYGHMYFDPSNVTFNNVAAGDGKWFIEFSSNRFFDIRGSNNITSIYGGKAKFEPGRRIIEGGSVVYTYKVIHESDNNKRAIIVRPLGIDTMVFNVPGDPYELELVAISPTDNSIVDFMPLSSISSPDIDESTGRVRFKLSKIQNLISDFEAGAANYKGFNDIGFRYRDTTTKRVSNLSPYRIVFDQIHKQLGSGRFILKFVG